MNLKYNGITLTKFSIRYRGFGIFIACSVLLAMSLYIFFKASMESQFTLVPKYLTVGIKSEFSKTIGSLPKREEGTFLWVLIW